MMKMLQQQQPSFSNLMQDFGTTKRASQRRYPLLEDVGRLPSRYHIDLDANDEEEKEGSSCHHDASYPDLCDENAEIACQAVPCATEAPLSTNINHNNGSATTTTNDDDDDDDDDEDYVMEVAPGVFKTIRRASHVQEAWENGDCIVAMCFLCDIRLACTDDCQGVVCPVCLAVSPVHGTTDAASAEGYVGIGLEID